MGSENIVKRLIKNAIYQRRFNPKPKRPKKWNRAYRPLVNKKAPKIKKKETYGKHTKHTPTTQTTKTLDVVSSLKSKIAGLEIKLAFGFYTYKYLQDILANGGIITIDENSAPSLINSVQKMVDSGYLKKDSKRNNRIIYKLTKEGFEGVKEILADPKLRNPKTLKSLNRIL